MKTYCRNCKHVRKISQDIRFSLGQENKEILNKHLRSGYKLEEFVYCTKFGYLESAIAPKCCEEWDSAKTESF